MVKKINSRENMFVVILLLLGSSIFLLFFSEATSPLTIDYPMDSTNFMIMGKMFADGKIPYIDFFDHKGPSLILIEGISQLFGDYRLGVFILQVLNLFLIFFIIYKTSRLNLKIIESLGIVLILPVFLKYLFTGGNNTEELCLLPTFISVYYLVRYLTVDVEMDKKDLFILGLSFSFAFWLRPNNALLTLGILFFFFLMHLIRKEWTKIKLYIVYVFLGQLPFLLLYGVYFFYHQALYEMIYASFLFNWTYANASWSINASMIQMNILLFCSLVIGCVICFFFFKREYKILLAGFVILPFAFLSANIGYGLSHYFINIIPAIVLGVLLFVIGFKKYKGFNIIITLIVFILFFRLLYYGADWIFTTREMKIAKYERKSTIYKEIYDFIPEEEREQLFIYDMLPEIYPLLNINPNYKYFILQEWMGYHDNKIYDDIDEMMQSENKPLWIIVYTFKIEENIFVNEQFVNRLNAEYYEFRKIDAFSLYKRNEY